MKKIYNQNKQKQKRKFLRNNLTKAEAMLWSSIKNKRLKFKFRRQHGIGNYIVDFYCPALKLVIELDGNVHYCYQQQIKKDKTRQRFLEDLDLKIKRYDNEAIINNIEGVLEDLNDYCQILAKNHG